MIKYKLICKDCETTFDSWFSSSKEYEKLKKKKFLNCHFCNSLNVGKGLMSPSVSTSKNNLRYIDSSSEKYTTGNSLPPSKPRTISVPKNPNIMPIHCRQVTTSFNNGPAKMAVKIG